MNLRQWLVFFLLLGIPLLGRADVFGAMEKALMPGPLHETHAKFEDDCDVCHKLFSKENKNRLCLECHDHKNIAQDIKAKQGFHGKSPDVASRECKLCHREHGGRKAALVLLDEQTFDHALTDFSLRGAHRDAPCGACHKKGKKYHQAPGQCRQCHERDDVHKGSLGRQCQSCHSEMRWQDFRFDHGVTKFELKGKHKGVACKSCHPAQRYQGTPKDCYACHKPDDKHQGKYGSKCQDCHGVGGWSSQRFDHDKDTDYPLKGRHAQVACVKCHQDQAEGGKRKKLETQCIACHRLQDEHRGLYGEKCKDCHSVEDWGKPTFNHDKTDYPLKGKHKDVACRDCHPGDLYKDKVKDDCYSCHRRHDVHREQQGKKCHECHNTSGWQEKVFFDHGLTKFPLLGAHNGLTCEECHSSESFKDTKRACVACHKEGDVHRQRLGEVCDECHNVTDWKSWSFDHTKQTDFELKGAHQGIVCNACHRQVVKGSIMKAKHTLPNTCYGCHRSDDAHEGEFGRNCGRCHGEDDFKDVRM